MPETWWDLSELWGWSAPNRNTPPLRFQPYATIFQDDSQLKNQKVIIARYCYHTKKMSTKAAFTLSGLGLAPPSALHPPMPPGPSFSSLRWLAHAITVTSFQSFTNAKVCHTNIPGMSVKLRSPGLQVQSTVVKAHERKQMAQRSCLSPVLISFSCLCDTA